MSQFSSPCQSLVFDAGVLWQTTGDLPDGVREGKESVASVGLFRNLFDWKVEVGKGRHSATRTRQRTVNKILMK